MEQEHVEITPPSRPHFSKELKVGYAVVIGCGALAVILGFLYLGTHLKSPFIITYEGERLVLGDEKLAQEAEEQKKKDTDGDSINDYEELNIYGTSPYLSDSDSDGITDDIEIAANTDPNCALGESCQSTVDEIGDDTEVAADLARESAEAAQLAAEQYAQVRQALMSMSVDEIRQMLIESGGDPAQVAAMSDEEVQALYSQVLAQLEANGGLEQLFEQASGDQATPSS